MVSVGDSRPRLDAESGAAVLAALERVLGSDVFRSAPQLSAFLSFIVERALDGRSAELKGYTVAVEAFGRPPDFDPQTDPIVRVEAGRLRKALTQYYLGDGAEDPIRISIPVGGYVPVFDFDAQADGADGGSEDAGASDDAPTADEATAAGRSLETRQERAVSQSWLMLAGVALVIGLASLAFWHRIAGQAPLGERAASEHVSLPEMQEPPHLPVLAITVLDGPRDDRSSEIARRVSGLLVDALSRFDDVLTVKAPGEAQLASDGADYVLELSGARFGEVSETAARLRSVKDDRIVWSTSSARSPTIDPSDPVWPEIARKVAIRLAEPFGVVHADFRRFATAPPMSCIYRALDFRRSQKPEDRIAAKVCLETVIARDPKFQPARLYLAILLTDEYTTGVSDAAVLDRALGEALQAVRLSPGSARAQQALMGVLFARGQTEEALVAGREATSRNPFDPDVMAGLGARLVQLNRPAEGLPLLQQAISLSTAHPPAYDFFAFLAARLTGQTKMAESHAANLMDETGPFSLIGRSMHYASQGDSVGLAKTIALLEDSVPLFRTDPRKFLERRGFNPAVVAQILTDLGLPYADLVSPR